MTAIAVSLATFVMTLLGGMFALRFKDHLHLILGFSAGALLGVAFFDLVPEAIALAAPGFSAGPVLALVMAGFVAYMVLDRAAAPRPGEAARDKLRQRGALGAASLSIHSFLDGFVIGLGFKASSAIGIVISTAVLVHDFSDGVNTVGIILGKQGDRRIALRWLLIDALAPVLGAASAVALSFSPGTLGTLLALCGGCFIYLSASDLLPGSYHGHPSVRTTVMTMLGILCLYVATRFAAV